MERLPDLKPYKLTESVEIKVQLAHRLGSTYELNLWSKGVEELPDWTFDFRGRPIWRYTKNG
jgi:hypothetical protein